MSTNNKPSTGKLYGIGLGPGDPDLLTIKAAKALQKVSLIFVPKSKEQESTALQIVRDHLPEDVAIEHLEFPMSKNLSTREASRHKNARKVAEQLDKGIHAAFLTLGDPMLYSTYSYILQELDGAYDVETIPGIFSFAAISNSLNMPLCTGNETLSVICSWDDETESATIHADTLICMKISAYRKQLYQYLSDKNNFNFTMVTDAGKTGQQIANSIEVLQETVPYFSTAIIKFNQ